MGSQWKLSNYGENIIELPIPSWKYVVIFSGVTIDIRVYIYIYTHNYIYIYTKEYKYHQSHTSPFISILHLHVLLIKSTSTPIFSAEIS